MSKRVGTEKYLRSIGYTDREAHIIRNTKNRYKIPLEIAIEYYKTKDKKLLEQYSGLDKIPRKNTLKFVLNSMGFNDTEAKNIRVIKDRYKIPLEIAIEYYKTRDKRLLVEYSTDKDRLKLDLLNKQILKKARIDDVNLCKSLGFTTEEINIIEKLWDKGFNIENAIISVKLNDKSLLTSNISFKQKYDAFNLKTGINTVRSLRGKEKFKDYTDLQVIAYYVQKEAESTGEDSLRKMCIDAGINYSTASGVKRRNPKLTNRQIIDSIIQSKLNSKYYVIIQGIRKEFDNIKQVSDCLEIDYQLIMQRKSSNKCSTEQAVLYYRPDCCINLLGEIVIPN